MNAQPESARVLIITDRAAATPGLLDTVRGRAARGPAKFHALMPNPAAAEWNPTHPEHHSHLAEAQRELDDALPSISEAAGSKVDGMVSGRHDPMDAVEETLNAEPFDELILATAPHPVEARLHVDLGHRLAHLGLPLTVVGGASPPPGS